jgi:hypothetical protein
MLATTEAHEVSVEALAAIALAVVIVARIVRIARLTSPVGDSAPVQSVGPAPTVRRCWWGPARKLERLADTTAVVRAEAELLHSRIEHVQASHQLEVLVAEINPVAVTRAISQPPPSSVAALSLPEIQELLAVIELDPRVRAELLQLAAARIAEKRA